MCRNCCESGRSYLPVSRITDGEKQASPKKMHPATMQASGEEIITFRLFILFCLTLRAFGGAGE